MTMPRRCHADPDAPYPAPGETVNLCGVCTAEMGRVNLPQKHQVMSATSNRPVGVLRTSPSPVWSTWQDLREHYFWNGGHPTP